MKTIILDGGYKLFRRWVLNAFSEIKPVRILGGLSGSGKTAALMALRSKGEQVLDIEGIANHRGSSYGMAGLPPQPTNEQFENSLALHWNAFDAARTVWVEDESRVIGKCCVPSALFSKMRSASVVMLDIPLEIRVKNLLNDYGSTERSVLIESTQRLTKRLGFVRASEVIALVQSGSLSQAIEIVLKYYDATYQHSLSRRSQPIQRISVDKYSGADIAEKLLGELYASNR